MGFLELSANRFCGVKLDRDKGMIVHTRTGRLSYKRTQITLAGAHATIELAGQIDRRDSTRLLSRAKQEGGASRKLYLNIEGSDAATVAEVPPWREGEARQFAARLNTAAKQAMTEKEKGQAAPG